MGMAFGGSMSEPRDDDLNPAFLRVLKEGGVMKKVSLVIIMFIAWSVLPGAIFADSDFGYETALKYYSKGEYEEALKRLDAYVKEKPDPAAYYLIGYSLYELGRFAEADENFNQAYLIDPAFSPVKIELNEKYPPVNPKKTNRRLKRHKHAAASMRKIRR
jgi:tetratricopeptide (TPR) repeat protein